MDIEFIIVGLSIVLIASAQSPPNAGSWDLITLASTAAGAPLSAEQSEQLTLLSADGMKRTEVRTTRIFRDSAGRIRVEFPPGGEYAQSTAFVTLVDPTARSVVTLLQATKMAFRLTEPVSAKGFGFAVRAKEGELRAGSPQTKTDDLGIRVIEGIEFRGTRTELIDQKAGSVATFTERWHSEPLGLTSLIVVVSANGSHSVALKNIQRGEPDPALFVVPLTYVIQDVRWPPHVLESLVKP